MPTSPTPAKTGDDDDDSNDGDGKGRQHQHQHRQERPTKGDAVVIVRRKKTQRIIKIDPESTITPRSHRATDRNNITSCSNSSDESHESEMVVDDDEDYKDYDDDDNTEDRRRHHHSGQEAQDEGDQQQKQSGDEKYVESEEAYRLRVYGTTEKYSKQQRQQQQQQHPRERFKRDSSFRRLSRQLSNAMLRRQSSIVESLPETPAGWAVLVSTVASSVLGYEIQLQKSLTCPPLVYGQFCATGTRNDAADSGHQSSSSTSTSVGTKATLPNPLDNIYIRMTASPDSILRRDIQPSLFVGTRSVASSMAGYLLKGPGTTDQHVCFRQVLTMAQDGAKIALDWELPTSGDDSTAEQRQEQIRSRPIQQPVVLILHGMNNHAAFGYVKSMMRTCTDRGWVAVGMNFRGCAHGLPLSTPRGYSGAYTGDLRHVVQHICACLDPSIPSAKLFLVGNSLGANLVCKYLGEEGLSGSLPEQIGGGVTLGNPMNINPVKMDPIMSFVLALGVKRTLVENWWSIRRHRDSYYRNQIFKALGSLSLAASDDALSKIMIRNEPLYPFGVAVGYPGGGPEYSHDASSYRAVRAISVPVLQIIASDDFLVGHTFRGKTYFSLANPNIMVVETRCGGHLGWQESPPAVQNRGSDGNSSTNSRYGLSSWSDVAAADFIEAILFSADGEKDIGVHFSPGTAINTQDHNFVERPPQSFLRSRL